MSRHDSPAGTGALFEDGAPTTVLDVVVLDVDAAEILPTYTYRAPSSGPPVEVGSCVCVPFGSAERIGYVLAVRSLPQADPLTARLRDIAGAVEGAVTFDAAQARSAEWLADRYVCDLATAVRCIAPAIMAPTVTTLVTLADPRLRGSDVPASLPQGHVVETLRRLGGTAPVDRLRDAAALPAFTSAYGALARKGLVTVRRVVERPRVVERTVAAYAPAASPPPGVAPPSRAGRGLLAALQALAARGLAPVAQDRLLAEAGASAAALRTLVNRGLVDAVRVPVRRVATPVPAVLTSPPALTPGQSAAARYLARAVSAPMPGGDPAVSLLFGVTASGKTEVYLDAIARTLDHGRGAIVLVPEIALTTQVVEVFTGRFGDRVAVLHSRLSDGERYDEWRRLQRGEATIAVGARSAVFAPVPNLGLMVVDEEHEASYKQESQPRYHARDVAIQRARDAGAAVVLGSATPSVETYHASETGRIARLHMPDRIGRRPLPNVQVADLREEFKTNRSLFSAALVDQLGARLGTGQQAILFLNRRGYAQFVLCRDCGHVAACPNCAVSLTLHAEQGSLVCHHCNHRRAAPRACPECTGTRIRGFGIGTEKVEEELLKHFPSARVARLDRDTTARKGAHEGILRRFRSGDADVLIGTQMVAKGLDFPAVTLVGVVSADTSINMPDFRAAERTFQLLTQVAGRAGRGDTPGTVIIQTFSPDHYSVQRAVEQDYEGFYAREVAFREELRYPPFSRLANLVCSDHSDTACAGRADRVASALRARAPEGVEVIGPAPAPLARLKGLYRRHVVLRAPVGAPVSQLVRSSLAGLPTAERRDIVVDIDPASLV